MLYNIKITEFNNLFNNEIFINIVDTLSVYNLLEDNKIQLRKKESKNFIVHFVMYSVIKLLRDSTANKNIIVVQPSMFHNQELETYCDINHFKNILHKILKDLKKYYPCNIIFLKTESDVTNPDVMTYVFNKSNKYINPSLKEIKSAIVLNNLNTNNFKLSGF